MVLKPCDVEFSKIFKNPEEGVMVQLKMSEIELHVAATTVHTVVGKFISPQCYSSSGLVILLFLNIVTYTVLVMSCRRRS